MAYDTTKLAQLSSTVRRLREREAEILPDLHGEILAALDAGMRQVEVAKVTGYTRDAIRQLVNRRRKAAA